MGADFGVCVIFKSIQCGTSFSSKAFILKACDVLSLL